MLSFNSSCRLPSYDIFLAEQIDDDHRQACQNDISANQIPVLEIHAEEIIYSKGHGPFIGAAEKIQRHDKLIPGVQEGENHHGDKDRFQERHHDAEKKHRG